MRRLPQDAEQSKSQFPCHASFLCSSRRANSSILRWLRLASVPAIASFFRSQLFALISTQPHRVWTGGKQIYSSAAAYIIVYPLHCRFNILIVSQSVIERDCECGELFFARATWNTSFATFVEFSIESFSNVVIQCTARAQLQHLSSVAKVFVRLSWRRCSALLKL